MCKPASLSVTVHGGPCIREHNRSWLSMYQRQKIQIKYKQKNLYLCWTQIQKELIESHAVCTHSCRLHSTHANAVLWTLVPTQCPGGVQARVAVRQMLQDLVLAVLLR